MDRKETRYHPVNGPADTKGGEGTPPATERRPRFERMIDPAECPFDDDYAEGYDPGWGW